MIMGLTQDIFKDAPDWVVSAAVDEDGECYWYSVSEKLLKLGDGFWLYLQNNGASCEYLGDGFDAEDWQNSPIDRNKHENQN